MSAKRQYIRLKIIKLISIEQIESIMHKSDIIETMYKLNTHVNKN